ncbi:MAG: hypothetical protein IKK92_08715, partial [Prevotella sp.]|nr:hypothetical protein [Prevotella sp.]
KRSSETNSASPPDNNTSRTSGVFSIYSSAFSMRSDGIIESTGEVSQDLIDYANSKNIPLLKYAGEDFADSYNQFYDTICGE